MSPVAGPLGESASFRRLRRFLTAIVIFGVLGMGAELLLIGHVEGVSQLVPVGVLAAGAASLAWNALRPRALTLWVVRATMLSAVGSGLVGVVLHYRGNEAFELEMYPAMSGVTLLFETVTGATPVLAPGSMALLGLVGLATVYDHPVLASASTGSKFETEGQS